MRVSVRFAILAIVALLFTRSLYAQTPTPSCGSGSVVRRLARSMPWIGAAVALLTVGAAIRRKGLFGGTLDTALDATPWVGAVKNTVEAIRGRDFVKDKTIA